MRGPCGLAGDKHALEFDPHLFVIGVCLAGHRDNLQCRTGHEPAQAVRRVLGRVRCGANGAGDGNGGGFVHGVHFTRPL